ncbi:hypothetical protein DICA2_E28568 [Diutina catenulata]
MRRSSRKTSSVRYQESSDSEIESDDASSSPSSSPPPVTRRPPAKRRKVAPRKSAAKKNGLEPELEPNPIFEAMSNKEVDVFEVVLEWMESYEDDANKAIATLINFVLWSCGSKHMVASHDVINPEAAAVTCEELALQISDQGTHVYPFKLAAFRANALEFFRRLTAQAHENGMLYDYEDGKANVSPLMAQIIAWLGSLSGGSIRPLRYTATIVLLTILRQITTLQKQVDKTITKLEKQKKRKQTALDSYKLQAESLAKYSEDIAAITLGNRYRDVDPAIRAECIKHLGEATSSSQEFLAAEYLKYYGWLLSDPVTTVRVETTKQLAKTYRYAVSVGFPSGIRQFSDRFKPQFIQMCQVDSSSAVRANTVAVLSEMLQVGLLESNEAEQVAAIDPSKELVQFILRMTDTAVTDAEERGDVGSHTRLACLCDIVGSSMAPELARGLGAHCDWEEIADYIEADPTPESHLAALFSLLYGVFASLLAAAKQKTKAELSETTLTKLAGRLGTLCKVALRHNLDASFLAGWNLLLDAELSHNIYTTYAALDQVGTYNEINSALISNYADSQVIAEYRQYFEIMLAAYHGSNNLCTAEIRVTIQDVAKELVAAVTEELEGSSPACDKLVNASAVMQKVSVLAANLGMSIDENRLASTLGAIESFDDDPEIATALSNALDMETAFVTYEIDHSENVRNCRGTLRQLARLSGVAVAQVTAAEGNQGSSQAVNNFYDHISTLYQIASVICSQLLDLVVLLRTFAATHHNLIDEKLAAAITSPLPEAVMNVFYYKEAVLAKLTDKTLEHADDEDVNIGDLVHSVEEPHQTEISEAEEDLSLFTLKLYAYAETVPGESPSIVERTKLNASKLGPVYQTIVDQHEKSHVGAAAQSEPLSP